MFKKKTPKETSAGDWKYEPRSFASEGLLGVAMYRENRPTERFWIKVNGIERIVINAPTFEQQLDASLRQAEKRCNVLNQFSKFRLSEPEGEEIASICSACEKHKASESDYLCPECRVAVDKPK